LPKASGRFVSLAPPQSYLDASTDEFSLSLALPARCWHAEFAYAGRNAYAALLALAPPDTFDFVSLQLYESWPRARCTLGDERSVVLTFTVGFRSRAGCMLSRHRLPLGAYLALLVGEPRTF